MSDDLVDDGATLTEEEEAVDSLGAPSLSAAIEALLLLADEPLTTLALAQATRCPIDEVEATVRSPTLA